MKIQTLSLTLLLAVSAIAFAQTPPPALKPVDNVSDWFKEGKFVMDYRLRYEFVEDGNVANDGKALTLRSRTGFRTAAWNNLSVFVEGESVYVLKEDYNSTDNGRTSFPTVIDPEGSEINQAYLAYGFGTKSQAIIGRQRIVLDNQRFFGNAGFRQNEQTFDAVFGSQALGDFTIKAAYLDEVHRIFGNSNSNPLLRQQDLSGALLNTSYVFPADAPAFLAGNTATAYGYFIDNQDLPLTSARTLGFRFTGGTSIGERSRLIYAAEYAQQKDYKDGSALIDADYSLIEVGYSNDGGRYVVKAVQETLGGNGRYAFQTPFATLHAFNGWADRFNVTPLGGLRDRYIDASAKFGPGILSAQWHLYGSDLTGQRYGKESGAQYLYQFNDRLFFTAKAANYQSDGFSADLQRFWLFADYRY